MSLISLLGSPVARSQPPEEAGLSVAPTLSLADLGTPANLAFYGIQGTESLDIPVPPGLTPVAFTANTQLPVNVRSGTITVMQDDRMLARVEVAPGDRAPIVLPLAGARIVDNAVSVTLRSYLLPVDGYCLDPTNPLRLSEGIVAFEGVERAPSVVSDFLPPVLRQLTLYVDDQPSQAESDAALRLATAVAAHYGSQAPVIELAPLADGPPAAEALSAPLHRHITVREDADTGVQLVPGSGVPALLISGPAPELANQSRLLTSDLGRLAMSSKAVAGPLSSTPQLPGNETSMRRLGQPGVNATALSPQVSVALDQTRLGRSAHHIRVHLRGAHTPLPEGIGGQVVASIAGEAIDRWPAEASGTIDRWVELPDRLLQRYTSLGVQLDISGNTGRCGEFQPLTLTIDGDSPILSSPAAPPVPGGFQSMPQSLMPRTVVGVDGGFDDLRRAVALLTGLQRLSALPIDTAVMPVADAVAQRGPAVIVSAAGWTDDRITLPVRADAGELTVERAAEPGTTSTLTLDPALRFGALQAVFDGQRSVLVATSNDAPDRLDDLLDWLGNDVRRWAALNGSALIAAPGAEPVLVGAGLPEAAETTAGQDGSTVYLVAGAALAALAAGAVGVLAHRRKQRAGSA